MQVAITSDIHNNLANLKKVLDYCADKKIRLMVCCGDLASLETLDFLNDNFSGEIFYCFGNMDDGQMKMRIFKNPSSLLPLKKGERIISPLRKGGLKEDFKNIQQSHALGRYKNTLVFKNHGETKIDEKSIAFVHYPDDAKELAESGKYDFVFYGHTHKPWEEEIGKCKILNPGNIANEIYPPTFAIWNTEDDKFKLVRVNELLQSPLLKKPACRQAGGIKGNL